MVPLAFISPPPPPHLFNGITPCLPEEQMDTDDQFACFEFAGLDARSQSPKWRDDASSTRSPCSTRRVENRNRGSERAFRAIECLFRFAGSGPPCLEEPPQLL